MAQELRRNERVRISPIRLIDADGSQVGILDTREALEKARAAGLDLVEVAPQAKPPVCRIMDYGKWKYAQKKKERKAKARRHATELKEIRIRTPKISRHDLQIKVSRAREFLQRGDRVRFTLRFRGREMAHTDLGQEILAATAASLADIAKVEEGLHMDRRAATMLLVPVVKSKRERPKAAPAERPAPAEEPTGDSGAAPTEEGSSAPPT
ncbi:MAG: hypothetical protein AMJ81_01830 [Phycisphaerae bacterium SM23_33]|nr:MAG: hypothetical protein AMJ81_01830 [Phycisphaerae bacterium SM23_33]